ncbi:MAG: ATP phosphoribosyltransferase [Planctomycetota bacterium]
MSSRDEPIVQLGLPKGRMQKEILDLLSEAGIRVTGIERGYRPKVSLPGFQAKILKPQNIVEMLHLGSRDLGFAGADWVRELEADVVELLDTGLDPVRIVAAAPESLLENGQLPRKPLVVASEYRKLTEQWIREQGLQATFVRSYGATEVFPPEDADCIVDNTATGSTLAANHLAIVGELMQSSTRLFAHPKTLEDPARRDAIERLVLVLRAVLEARQRVMVEVNVGEENLEQVISVLPCMREPTVARLHGDAGYAVRAAVPRIDLPRIIPEIKARGGTDVVVSDLSHIVP